MQAANRTWAIFIGVGDYETNSLDIIGYKQDSAVAYTDVTMPSVTGMPYLESVCYVDKHPQVCSVLLCYVILCIVCFVLFTPYTQPHTTQTV